MLPSGTAADDGQSTCTTCHAKRHPGYSPAASTTAAKVGCHDNECATVRASEAGELPTICRLNNPDGQPSCPRDEVPGKAGRGLGHCVEDPGVVPGNSNLHSCADHLDPPCAQVITQAGYPCNYDMGNFDPTLWGTLLQEECPETCGQCTSGGTRYCTDNALWTSNAGHSCHDYAIRQELKDRCFDDEQAFAACPVACGACGDCCGSFADDEDICFFRSQYEDGSEVSGVKFRDLIALPGSSVQAGTGDGENSYTTTSTFGLITDERDNFLPDEEIDGVWGIGNIQAEANCNPSCGSMQPFEAFISTDFSDLDDMFAICLSPGSGIDSWDIGEIVGSRIAQGATMHYHEIVDSFAYQIVSPRNIFAGSTEITLPATIRHARTIFDLNGPGFEFPSDVYDRVIQAFITEMGAGSTFGNGELRVDDLFNESLRCASPVPVNPPSALLLCFLALCCILHYPGCACASAYCLTRLVHHCIQSSAGWLPVDFRVE